MIFRGPANLDHSVICTCIASCAHKEGGRYPVKIVDLSLQFSDVPGLSKV